MTASSAGEPFDSERLEFLGDAVLKWGACASLLAAAPQVGTSWDGAADWITSSRRHLAVADAATFCVAVPPQRCFLWLSITDHRSIRF